MIRILLADDEPMALQHLKLAVACITDAELVGCARNGREAVQMIRAQRPDIAVLDIQMPGMDGFEAIEALDSREHVPEIIFVTAYHDHAVRAFEIQAVDYLLKPVPLGRFRDAINLARQRMRARTAEERFAELQELIGSLHEPGLKAPPAPGQDIWVRSNTGLVRVPMENIDLVCAEGDYVSLHVNGQVYLHKDTMNAMAERLDPKLFMRVHRSAIVNLSRVDSVRRRSSRSISLLLDTGDAVAVGPSYAKATLAALTDRR